MKKQHLPDSPVLRFKRWSRRGYAAFISLKQTVTIGHLSANVAERFQTKNNSIHSSVLSDGIQAMEMEKEEARGPEEFRMLSGMQLRELTGILTAIPNDCRVVTAAFVHTILKNKISSPEGFSIILGPSGFFYIPIQLYDRKTKTTGFGRASHRRSGCLQTGRLERKRSFIPGGARNNAPFYGE